MRLLKNKWFWAVAFGAVFALSIDLWAWDWTAPSLLGMPYIVEYTILLIALLFVLFFLFAKYYWTPEEER